MYGLAGCTEVLILAQWSLAGIWESVWPYLVMLLGFSAIVFVHELGHFGVAKWAGVRVDKFAIGFGRELVGFTWGETRYSFNLLPLGGYVKMLGQEDFEDKTNELVFKNDPRSFINKPVGRRMAIVSAGVVMNVVFACLLFMLAFLIGIQAMGTRVAYVVPDSPAERAGLLPGDVIRKINSENILEFNEVHMAIMLAAPHEPIHFVVERDGEQKFISVQPEYSIPENPRDIRRQTVGIAPGKTREIVAVGPEMDPTRPDHPRVGDILVEIDGIPVTDENVNEVINTLAYTQGSVFVERVDPKHPAAPPQKVKVQIPPILTIYPSDDLAEQGVNVLGLIPLVRFDTVYDQGRAYLAGIEEGDTILTWNDERHPGLVSVARAIQDSPERDVHFTVQKRDGRIRPGFIRPRRNQRGPATVQAVCEPIPGVTDSSDEPAARFTEVRRDGQAAQAGIEGGDVILSCLDVPNPTASAVKQTIRSNAGRALPFTVRKRDGRVAATQVTPEPPGSIDARYNLVADDVLLVGGVAETVHGRPSPAAQSGIEPGSRIAAVNGQPVARWRELIDAFRLHAGSTVNVDYHDVQGQRRVAPFPVPHCLRTLLAVGPEARMVGIDGRRTVSVESSRGREEVAVGYREGTRAILTELVGRSGVRVEYRENPLADVRTGTIDVTPDMVDPWLGRVGYSANIDVGPELKLLKGDNAAHAIWIGFHKTYYFVLTVYKTFQRMFFTRSVGVESISGPLGIIGIGGKVARAGFVDFVFFMAVLSANLAVINFLPLPIVDGGLMVFLLIEKIKGSPVSLRVQVATQMIGLFLIVGILVFVTFNDVMRIYG